MLTMSGPTIFLIVLLTGSAYAFQRGGAPERITAFAYLVAFGFSVLLQQPMASRYIGVEWGILTVDLGLLVVLLGVALYSDRFWPLWVAALHALSTGAHLVGGMDHGIEPVAYAILLISWSYPMILFLVIGTHRHSKRKQVQGFDLDWSPPQPAGAR